MALAVDYASALNNDQPIHAGEPVKEEFDIKTSGADRRGRYSKAFKELIPTIFRIHRTVKINEPHMEPCGGHVRLVQRVPAFKIRAVQSFSDAFNDLVVVKNVIVWGDYPFYNIIVRTDHAAFIVPLAAVACP